MATSSHPGSDDLDFGATLRGFAAGQMVLKRYQLERILGRGGMGVVWLAHDTQLAENVALKFLPETVASDESALEDLKREVRKARALTHPNIVRIHDFVTDGNAAAVAMEVVDGKTLSALRLSQPEQVFSVEALQPLVTQACAALDYAHQKAKVVHRDLKPANLMVTTGGDLKILDFGIAASISESASRVSNRGTSGTLTYMSPQQLLGKVPTAADDLYALGATLYELLTGKPPFFRGDLASQIQNHAPEALGARRSELGVIGQGVPLTWERTVAALLAKEPQDRPPSGAAVLALLRGENVGPALLSGRSLAKADAAVPPIIEQGKTKKTERVEANALGETHSSSTKKPLWFAVTVAAAVALGGIGYYFGVVVPEKTRQAEAALHDEQARLAETTRLEAAAVAEKARRAEESRAAERKKQADLALENERLAAKERAKADQAKMAAEKKKRLKQARWNELGEKFATLKAEAENAEGEMAAREQARVKMAVLEAEGKALQAGDGDLPNFSGWVGKKIDLNFVASDGSPFNLEWMKGKVVLLEFWASWCPPCHDEAKKIVSVYSKYHESGFEIVGISLDSNRQKFDAFLTAKKITWVQSFTGAAWDNVFARRFSINSIPTLWLIDKSGVICDVTCRDDLDKKVAQLLKEPYPDSDASRMEQEANAATKQAAMTPEPSAVFKTWVEELKIGGVRGGISPRIAIGSSLYSAGDLVDAQLSITFVGYDVNTRLATFQDRTGARVERRL